MPDGPTAGTQTLDPLELLARLLTHILAHRAPGVERAQPSAPGFRLPAPGSRLEAGVLAWRLFCIFPKGRARHNAELKLSDDQLRELFAWMAKRRRELAGTGFALNFGCEGYLPPRWDRAVRDQPYFCRAGINIASVLCDGAIGACPNITRRLVQGSIRADDFMAISSRRFRIHPESNVEVQGCNSVGVQIRTARFPYRLV